MTTTADLLDEARAVIEDDAEIIKGGCEVQGREWACPDCDPATCGGRKQHADLLDLAARLKAHSAVLRGRPCYTPVIQPDRPGDAGFVILERTAGAMQP